VRYRYAERRHSAHNRHEDVSHALQISRHGGRVPTLPLTVSQRRAFAVLAACVLAVALVFRHQHAGGGTPALRVAPVAVAPARAAPKQIVVDVAGAVRRPGLYRLRQGARVADAVARAGGLTRRAERRAVNLAAPVSDGQQVLVAERGPGGAAADAASQGSPPGAPVSLSSATVEQLDALPGIGPVTAQKIISYRQQHGPFTSVEALDAIPGIGPARIADLQGLVVP
jgi:competence protein ComEA